MPEAVITASIVLDALLLRGDLAEQKAAGIRFRAGTETAITRELRAIPVDRHHVIDHHYIAGRLKPSCWRPSVRPWARRPATSTQSRSRPLRRRRTRKSQFVGARGFEPPTSSSRTMRATKLRHAPTEAPSRSVGRYRG